jgi:hypothetical protein
MVNVYGFRTLFNDKIECVEIDLRTDNRVMLLDCDSRGVIYEVEYTTQEELDEARAICVLGYLLNNFNYRTDDTIAKEFYLHFKPRGNQHSLYLSKVIEFLKNKNHTNRLRSDIK